MDEQLRLYAASEEEVRATLGLGARDEAAAERALARIELFATDELDVEWDFVELAARTLLWGGQPNARGVALPFDQVVDCYWAALEAIVAAVSWADLAVPNATAAVELDEAFAEAGTPTRPMEVANRARVGLDEPTQFDVRVIGHADAVALANGWLGAETPEPDPLAAFWRDFLGLAARAEAVGRPVPDLWLWTPSHELAHERYPDDAWPPAELETRPVPDALREFVSERTAPAPLRAETPPPPPPAQEGFAPRPELDEQLADDPGGTYTTGGGISPDGWWTVRWRFADGLVRIENRPNAAVGPRYWYGRLSNEWGTRFDEALRATPFPTAPDQLPVPDERMHALSLGKPAVLVPASAATQEPWKPVFALLDSVVLTLAQGQFLAIDGAAPEPASVEPV